MNSLSSRLRCHYPREVSEEEARHGVGTYVGSCVSRIARADPLSIVPTPIAAIFKSPRLRVASISYLTRSYYKNSPQKRMRCGCVMDSQF
ncbi:hypothetical protein PHMEG_0004740 [Phytophthora megakarya]|uniref:Uncharacterized protein n=1 Tax=Phytophthora megakarya TaxID=4795 RepID=A0A225WSY7_9STRA|nr:hypothetical protein PHMEG_0004740 [Phytophthora megakarya]